MLTGSKASKQNNRRLCQILAGKKFSLTFREAALMRPTDRALNEIQRQARKLRILKTYVPCLL